MEQSNTTLSLVDENIKLKELLNETFRTLDVSVSNLQILFTIFSDCCTLHIEALSKERERFMEKEEQKRNFNNQHLNWSDKVEELRNKINMLPHLNKV